MFKGAIWVSIILLSFQTSWAQTSADDVISVDNGEATEELSIQVEEPQSTTTTETKKRSAVEKIEVTGSHIKRIHCYLKMIGIFVVGCPFWMGERFFSE